MKEVLPAVGQFKPQLIRATTYSFINKVFDLMPPFLTAWLIDVVSGQTPSWITWLNLGSAWNEVVFVIILTILIFYIESFFEWLFKKGFMELAQNIQHSIRMKTYNALQKKNMKFFNEERTGNLLSILNDDINQLERFFNSGLNEILQLVILVVVAGASLCVQSPSLGLLGMLPIPFIIYGSLYYQKKVAPLYLSVRNAVGSLSNRLENNIAGIEIIKSFGTEDFELNRVETESEAYRLKNFEAIRWNSVYIPLIRVLITFGFAGTLLIGAYWVLNDMNGFTYGTLAFFAMMIQRLLWPITGLGRVFDDYERARASSKRIFGLINDDQVLEYGERLIAYDGQGSDIEFEGLSFEYKKGQTIIDNLNLHIPANTSLGIVGTTGAGKTTLVHLLMRFYEPISGQLRINGHDIKQYDLQDLRQHISMVSQEVFLFHGTLRDNIAYGSDLKDEKNINSIVERAQLKRFVDSLPLGLETVVGERGVKLSGGQKQRVSLARALLKNTPIVVLDEATSAIDSETEAAIQSNLKTLLEGKTAIIIAHRLSTLKSVDQIIVLNQGKIQEKGSHKELLDKNSRYAAMWAAQQE